jgi:chromate reductase
MSPDAPETPEMLAAKEVVRASDAVLIFMPEYNYSLPGPLKNAIDAMSRGEGGNCFKNKALGMISGGGPARGMKAQYHMRDISVFLDLHVMNKPELGINFFEAGVLEGEGAEMKLVHADHQRRVKEYVEALVAYTAKIKTAFA